MARQLKTNGIYNINCVLTDEPAGTTPAVFAERAGRYGVTIELLRGNYIGRTGAKLLKTLVNENGMSAGDAIVKIRESFKVTNDSPIADAIVNKIVGRVSAKTAKAKATAEFAARKAAALAILSPSKPSKVIANDGKPAASASKTLAAIVNPPTKSNNCLLC